MEIGVEMSIDMRAFGVGHIWHDGTMSDTDNALPPRLEGL
jgi:hypothetical protein